jgi:hypothetical protein
MQSQQPPWFAVARAAWILAQLSAPAICAEGEVLKRFIPEGLTKMRGGYRPLDSSMDQTAEILKRPPETPLEAPRYGFIEIDGRKWAFVWDAPTGKSPRIFVDCNGDGDLTNDPGVEWKQRGGSFMLDLGKGRQGRCIAYQTAELSGLLLFYPDYGFEWSFELDGQPFAIHTPGEVAGESHLGIDRAGKSLLKIDRNGDGRFSYHYETVRIGEPFNFTGSTYVFTRNNDTLTLAKSEQPVKLQPPPPKLFPGNSALKFAAKNMAGGDVQFPGDYAGKLVLLDFWPHWTRPSAETTSSLREAYAAHHQEGFEILAVYGSGSKPNDWEELTEVLERLQAPWPEVYDDGRDPGLLEMYDAGGFRLTLLVDGDTGSILGRGFQDKRGRLSARVAEELERKKRREKPANAGRAE